MHKARRRRDARRRHKRNKTNLRPGGRAAQSMQDHRKRQDAAQGAVPIDETADGTWHARCATDGEQNGYASPLQAIQAVRAGQPAHWITLCPLSTDGKKAAEEAQATEQGIRITDYQIWVAEDLESDDYAVCFTDGETVTVKRCESIDDALEWLDQAAPSAAVRVAASTDAGKATRDEAIAANYALELLTVRKP